MFAMRSYLERDPSDFRISNSLNSSKSASPADRHLWDKIQGCDSQSAGFEGSIFQKAVLKDPELAKE